MLFTNMGTLGSVNCMLYVPLLFRFNLNVSLMCSAKIITFQSIFVCNPIRLCENSRFECRAYPCLVLVLFMYYGCSFYCHLICLLIHISSSGVITHSYFLNHLQIVTRDKLVMFCICVLEIPIRIR